MFSHVAPGNFTPAFLLNTHVHVSTHMLYIMHAIIACNPVNTAWITVAQIWYYCYVTLFFLTEHMQFIDSMVHKYFYYKNTFNIF